MEEQKDDKNLNVTPTDVQKGGEVEYKLTQYSHGAGCGCKIAPNVLQQILATNTQAGSFPQLLVGNNTNDDAAVYEMTDGKCLISTTDFFTPIVDDAFTFGQIAAANAISDVYAMGGWPMMALAILGWPVEKLPASLAAQVMEGARSICKLVNIPLAGGHSIDSPEPFFGLSVNGYAPTQNIKRNNTAKAGNVLYITKPLGVGVLSTAQKRGLLQANDYEMLVKQLTSINTIGQALGALPYVHAVTDITGFGLLGHLIEMCKGANLNAIVNYNNLPVLPAAKEFIKQRVVPDATFRNWNSYSTQVKFEAGVNVMEAFSLLPDPQTNGGLMIAVAPENEAQLKQLFTDNGIENLFVPIATLHNNEQATLIYVAN
jgi:selenide, water dikinase